MSQLMNLNAIWLIVFGVLLAAGLWLLIGGLAALLRGRLLRGPIRAAFGLGFAALAFLGAGIRINLLTWNTFNQETPVATVSFVQLEPRQFEARIGTPGGEERIVIVNGDEWQLDARVIKWKGFALLLGLKPVYRLDRFSGRYSRVVDEREARRSVFGLSSTEHGLDVWKGARRLEEWLPVADTHYGSSVFMPMADRAVFEISLTEDALIARPANGEARSAVRNW